MGCPGASDEAADGDDHIGEIEEGGGRGSAVFVAVGEAVVGVLPGAGALHVPASTRLDSEAGLRLTAAADCYWEGMAGLADTDLDGRITRAEFVTAAQAGLHQDPGAFARIALPRHQAVLDVADPDAEQASSTASTVERVLVALGAEPHRARLISAEHRTDPTGRITHEEILREVENYYTTATPQRAFPVPA